MINPIRAAALVLAAAVLSMPAAAQGDASFAAALGRLPSGLAVMAELKTQPQKPAANESREIKFDAAVIERIARRAMASGVREEAPTTTVWVLTEVLRNPDRQFKAGAVTTPLPDGVMLKGILFRMTLVAGADFENFSYWVDGQGNLLKARRHLTVRGSDGEFVELPHTDLDPADAAVRAKLFELFNHWAK